MSIYVQLLANNYVTIYVKLPHVYRDIKLSQHIYNKSLIERDSSMHVLKMLISGSPYYYHVNGIVLTSVCREHRLFPTIHTYPDKDTAVDIVPCQRQAVRSTLCCKNPQDCHGQCEGTLTGRGGH